MYRLGASPKVLASYGLNSGVDRSWIDMPQLHPSLLILYPIDYPGRPHRTDV